MFHSFESLYQHRILAAAVLVMIVMSASSAKAQDAHVWDGSYNDPATQAAVLLPNLPPSSSVPGSVFQLALNNPAASSGLPNVPVQPAAAQIGPAVQSGVTVDQPPLQEEVLHWYSYPLRWMTDGWKNHAEFGIDGSDGNADTLALQTGLEMKRKTDLYTFAIDLDYRQASNAGVTTENNGRFNTDFDRKVGDSNWTMFNKFGLEWDKFKAFDLRVNINGGVGYYWLNDDQSTFITRFGAGASREIGAADDDWIPEGVFGIEAEHQLTKRQKLKGKVDYFPSFENFNDFRLVSDFAWEILLDGSENLSLKLALTDRYDSTPQGAKPNDVYYSFLLLYKF